MATLFDDLSDLAKFRLGLILQGTQSGIGCNIIKLKFSRDLVKQKNEINGFIDLINRKFQGILQLIHTNDYIAPLIKNKKAEDYSYRILQNDEIALSLVILMHRFYNSQGPTLKNIEDKLAGTNLSGKNLNSLLKSLQFLRFVEKRMQQGVEWYEPTPLLKACASQELLVKIMNKVYKQTNDPVLFNFIPESEYRIIQSKVGNKIISLKDFMNLKKEPQQETNGDYEDGE